MIDPDAVKARMAKILKLPPSKLQDAALMSDLVRESFVLVEMVIQLQDDFNVRLVAEDLKDVKTVGDLIAAMARNELPS